MGLPHIECTPAGIHSRDIIACVDINYDHGSFLGFKHVFP